MNFLAPGSDGQVRTKICGLRRIGDLAFCQEQSIDAVGLNFWPKSKRYLEPALAATWLGQMPKTPTRVGVFVNEPTSSIQRLLEKGIIEIAQLHGDETPEDCAKLKMAGFPVIKAIGVKDSSSLAQLSAFDVGGIVLDAFCPGDYGGSGKTFNWELALEAREILGDTPLILSGGLVSANVAEAIQKVRPHAVDVASGVESAPGVKSKEMIADFLQTVRSA
ncbi:phosphoribosylanthranilate isomerase [Verrucomicrobiales bacterium]|jgi:phosphoribosylanthranilate isomerase|nr:phosphoribosylanthranilate isomerase [Verrucomicrobiales bacterium]MDA7613963.1 phosphoribosylanthranilate isomerase [Verrucomicrobiales bacterium]MDA7666405.1 phosphoribosylanthranilate isomerase [bacterium]MDC0503294.1 phosphoribosylanthranilate isomerase [Verrucomicrobiales bacterium]NCF87479.1 N-(5'-phosphoribosyl)anthranilate isomerase [Verrucomicrobiaceae bacterium]